LGIKHLRVFYQPGIDVYPTANT